MDSVKKATEPLAERLHLKKHQQVCLWRLFRSCCYHSCSVHWKGGSRMQPCNTQCYDKWSGFSGISGLVSSYLYLWEGRKTRNKLVLLTCLRKLGQIKNTQKLNPSGRSQVHLFFQVLCLLRQYGGLSPFLTLLSSFGGGI